MLDTNLESLADMINGLKWYCAKDRNGRTLANSEFTGEQLHIIAAHFARELKGTNPRFNSDLFTQRATR